MTSKTDQIIAIMNRYGVRKLYTASTKAGSIRYGVFNNGKLCSGPKSHSEAKRKADELAAADILELLS